MIKWFCLPELLSLFFLVLIYVYYRDKNAVLSFRRRVFHWIFRLSILSMALDLVCANLLFLHASVPQGINEGLNEVYFILIVITESAIALYVYDLLCGHDRKKRDYRAAVGGLAAFNVVFAAVALTNSLTGALFSFSPDGSYIRGPLNKLGYAVMLAELAIGVVLYARNRAMLPGRVSHVIWTLPPVALLLGGLQFLYPEVLLNGTILTSAVFVLYSNFQTCRVEQDSLTKLGNRPALYRGYFAEGAARLSLSGGGGHVQDAGGDQLPDGPQCRGRASGACGGVGGLAAALHGLPLFQYHIRGRFPLSRGRRGEREF